MKINDKIKILIDKFRNDFEFSSQITSILEDISDNVNVIEDENLLIQTIKNMIDQTNYSLILYTPVANQEILTLTAETAFQRKKVRFLLVCNWDLQVYGKIIKKMRMLGNIQFRNIEGLFNYYLCSRDASEWLFGKNEDELISIHSEDKNKCKVFNEILTHFVGLTNPIGARETRKKAKKEKKKKKMSK